MNSHPPGATPASQVDVLLIHPDPAAPATRSSFAVPPYPPLGLLSVAAALRQAGQRVAILDQAVDDEPIERTLQRTAPRWVGIGSWCAYRSRARRVIEHLAGCGVPIVVGGPDASLFPDAYLAVGADIVVVGEGEQTAVELSRALLAAPDRLPALSALEPIAGLVLANGGSPHRTAPRPRLTDLGQLPVPAYDLVATRRYLDAWRERTGVSSLPLMTARGCPFHCAWCARPVFGARYVQRPVASVVAELALLVTGLGADHIRIIDDVFALRRHWLVAWAAAIRRIGLHFEYECLVRADQLDDGMVALLRDSGCRKVFCGIESGSQRVLDAMRKQITVDQVRSAARRLRRAGIQLHAYLMLGYPGERHADVLQTHRLVDELRPDEVSVALAQALPGTAFYRERHGDRPPEFNWDDSVGGVAEPVDADRGDGRSALYYRLARSLLVRGAQPQRDRGLLPRATRTGLDLLWQAVHVRDVMRGGAP